MELKRQLTFKLRPSGRTNITYLIQLHVTFNGRRLKISSGSKIDSLEAWDATAQTVRSNYIGTDGETALSINNTLQRVKESMAWTFQFYEVNDKVPTLAEIKEKFQERYFGAPKQHKRLELTPSRDLSFDAIFDLFTSDCGNKNAWTPATYEKMAALRNDLTAFKPNISLDDLTDSGLADLVAFLRDEKQLRTPRKKKGNREEYDTDDIVGIKNSTIEKKLGYLRWFLNWATEKGYNTNKAFKSFRPTLKRTQKKVIYLTKEDIGKIKNLDLTTKKAYLNPVRDVFLFCCFSGLRHSDVYNLRRTNIKKDHLEITTVKTADSLSIELNTITKGILRKYEDVPFPDDKALPVLQNQPMNRDLKELCKLAGINERISITTYKGNKRIDETKEKWELIGTHTGRRTFIVNALSMNIAPNVVMKWTGHSDYKSMKPYIDIVDSIKAASMTKFDELANSI